MHLVVTQDYDPSGEYIKHWVPELARVATSRIHEPWLMSHEEQVAAGCRIGTDYPAPMKSTFKFLGDSRGDSRKGGRGGGHRGKGGRGDRRRAPSTWELYG